MIAIIVGSSGLVGQNLLEQLCDNEYFTRIITLTRKASGKLPPKVKEIIVDFDDLEASKEFLKGDVVFSCLGSSKSKESKNYYKIDYEYPVKVAWLAAENKVPQFHIVSAMGAKEKSGNSYLKLKGETEINISVIKFESTHFYRPSVLKGKASDVAPLDKLSGLAMKVVNPFLLGSAKKYRSIEAADLAKAMIAQSLKHLSGTFYYESDEIQRIADHS